MSSLTNCILCAEKRVEEFLDLGDTGLANKFRTREELERPEPRFPLAVGFCHACTHVQLTSIVPPSAMFEDYLYISSASDTLKQHLYDLSDALVARHALERSDLVVDIGCNDGTLLGGFQRHGVRTLGVDPARNLAERTNGADIERFVGFFGSRSADEIVRRWGRASVMTATNTFPHIPDLDDFVGGLSRALAPDGAFVIEAHYLVDLLEQGAFDTIYHEHVSYWALGPMTRLFARHGFEIVDAERLPIHHGQLRVTVMRAGQGRATERVHETLELESRLGLDRLETFVSFADDVRRIKRDLHEFVADVRDSGARVAGYGAPAKGNTLLSFLALGPDTIEFIADRSPLKQGLYTPNSEIPVVSPERLLTEQPDYVLLLAWNFADEILEQQAEYRRRGGKFIVPIPHVHLV